MLRFAADKKQTTILDTRAEGEREEGSRYLGEGLCAAYPEEIAGELRPYFER